MFAEQQQTNEQTPGDGGKNQKQPGQSGFLNSREKIKNEKSFRQLCFMTHLERGGEERPEVCSNESVGISPAGDTHW